MIMSIFDVEQESDYVTITALIEDADVVYPQTYLDPPEYGPAMCKASFYIDENEILPEDKNKLIDYLEDLNLDWKVLPKDWDY